jgi:hypothetical protein
MTQLLTNEGGNLKVINSLVVGNGVLSKGLVAASEPAVYAGIAFCLRPGRAMQKI